MSSTQPRPRFGMRNRHYEAMRGFADACQRGDIAAVRGALKADAVGLCDGGGVVPAALGPVPGAENVAQLAAAILRAQPDTELTLEAVNGRTGLALRRADQATAVVAVKTTNTKITVLWIVLNPTKLGGWHRR